jgi:hypothetical protein
MPISQHLEDSAKLPGLSIQGRKNRHTKLSKRRINTDTEQRNRFPGITEILTFPVPAIIIPLRGILATLVS